MILSRRLRLVLVSGLDTYQGSLPHYTTKQRMVRWRRMRRMMMRMMMVMVMRRKITMSK